MYRPATADQLLALEVCAGIGELARSERFAAAEPDMVAAIVEGIGAFAAGEWAPLNRVGDLEGARLENGVVRLPQHVSNKNVAQLLRKLIGSARQLGWVNDVSVYRDLRSKARPNAESLRAFVQKLDAERGNLAEERPDRDFDEGFGARVHGVVGRELGDLGRVQVVGRIESEDHHAPVADNIRALRGEG